MDRIISLAATNKKIRIDKVGVISRSSCRTRTSVDLDLLERSTRSIWTRSSDGSDQVAALQPFPIQRVDTFHPCGLYRSKSSEGSWKTVSERISRGPRVSTTWKQLCAPLIARPAIPDFTAFERFHQGKFNRTFWSAIRKVWILNILAGSYNLGRCVFPNVIDKIYSTRLGIGKKWR